MSSLITTQTSGESTRYTCTCDWCGTLNEMAPIDDVEDRVGTGELMAAGQCPKCGDLLSVADEDVPDYTLNIVAEIMTARGWTVAPPSA